MQRARRFEGSLDPFSVFAVGSCHIGRKGLKCPDFHLRSDAGSAGIEPT